jgi:hypothetical protein
LREYLGHYILGAKAISVKIFIGKDHY